MSTKPELWFKIPFELCTFLYVCKKQTHKKKQKKHCNKGRKCKHMQVLLFRKKMSNTVTNTYSLCFNSYKTQTYLVGLIYCKQIPIN